MILRSAFFILSLLYVASSDASQGQSTEAPHVFAPEGCEYAVTFSAPPTIQQHEMDHDSLTYSVSITRAVLTSADPPFSQQAVCTAGGEIGLARTRRGAMLRSLRVLVRANDLSPSTYEYEETPLGQIASAYGRMTYEHPEGDTTSLAVALVEVAGNRSMMFLASGSSTAGTVAPQQETFIGSLRRRD